jgi:thioredoxin reductase (NADPH)
MTRHEDDEFDVAVIGGGVAGAAAVLRAAQYHLRTLWLLGDRKTAKASRSKYVANIDNMIGVHPDIVTSKLDDELAEQLEHMHISAQDLIDNVQSRVRKDYPEHVVEVQERALRVERDHQRFAVHVADRAFVADGVVLATGVMDRQPSIAKRKGDKVIDQPMWVYPFANRESVLYCIRCEGHLTRDRKVAVIGSSEVAAQVSIMLAERYGSTSALLANGEAFTIEPRTERLLDHYGIERHGGRIVDLEGQDGPAKYAGLRALTLDDGTRVEVAFALVSLGMYRVYNDLARELGAELIGEGPEDVQYVKIDSRGETTVRGLFAIGDIARREDEPVMMQVYTSQEYAVRALDTIDRRRRSRARKLILGEPLSDR